MTKLYKILNTFNVLSQPSHYAELFQTLDQWLWQHKHLWDVQSFHSQEWPWWSTEPELCDWLSEQQDGLTAEAVEQALIQYVTGFERLSFTWQKNIYLNQEMPPSHFNAGIKGRKWQQICAFSQRIRPISPVVEWCAGKGHLGKLLAYQHDATVVSLEWQAGLCEAGQREAEARQLTQHFVHTDVLKGEGVPALQTAKSAVALHACGDLHTTLIEQAIAANVSYLAFSPCCYHLTQQTAYEPLSTLGQQAQVKLSRENLRLAVKEVATAGLREQRLKQIELSYRLGFDAWQRQVTGHDHYLNVPTCSKSLLTQGFSQFAYWAATQKSLLHHLQERSFEGFEAEGEKRSQYVAKVEAVCQYFRRPLELWLVLDRALRLQEAGYQVTIETFCDKALTPRNFLICAQC